MNNLHPIFQKILAPFELIQNIPAQYRGDLTYTFNEKRSVFQVCVNGHVFVEAEDSEVANAICVVFNKIWAEEDRCPTCGSANRENMHMHIAHRCPDSWHKARKEEPCNHVECRNEPSCVHNS